jgi:hypothetical protein
VLLITLVTQHTLRDQARALQDSVCRQGLDPLTKGIMRAMPLATWTNFR